MVEPESKHQATLDDAQFQSTYWLLVLSGLGQELSEIQCIGGK